MLESLHIQNYKSLHEVRIESLPDFFAIVGANAAGKTNFADAIEFLSIVARSGLAAAVNERGGYENICFRRQRRSKGAIRIECSLRSHQARGQSIHLNLGFSFRAQKEAIRANYIVESEQLALSFESDGVISPYVEIRRRRKEVGLTAHAPPPRSAAVLPASFLKELFNKDKFQPRDDELLLWTFLRGLPPFDQLLGALSRFRVFQVAPSFARRSGAASGNQELGKFGENLPAVLDWLQREHPARFEKLLNHARQAVPTIEKIETDYVETRELGLFLKEKGMQRRLFASELSDGTLRTLAMFVPLIDPRIPLVVLEEPENSIHPWVIRTFVDACRLCAAEKQIILTTHSPVLVSKLKPNELYIAERSLAETSLAAAISTNVEIEELVRKGIQDLGSYWDSGAMRAVPRDPQYEFDFATPDKTVGRR